MEYVLVFHMVFFPPRLPRKPWRLVAPDKGWRSRGMSNVEVAVEEESVNRFKRIKSC